MMETLKFRGYRLSKFKHLKYISNLFLIFQFVSFFISIYIKVKMYHYDFKDSVINRCSYRNVRYLKQTQEAPKKHVLYVKNTMK